MRNMRLSAVVLAALLGVGNLTACGGGDDEPTVTLEWVTTPPSAVERGQTISASFSVVTDDPELTVDTAGLLACSGAVPDCGLTGMDAIGYQAGASEADGVYSASLEITEQGNWTVVGYAFVGGDYISPPLGVIVDKLSYPSGPYGYNPSSVVENFSLLGFKDSDDADSDPFNETARQIELNEFFQGEDLDAKIILVNVGAGWCPYCNEEMQYMSPRYDQFYNRGIRIFSVVAEDDDYNPVTIDFAKVWGARFNSKMPTAIDPQYDLEPYYPESSLPLNVYIDARSMKIIESYVGWSSDSLNQIFDYYAP